MEIWQKQKQEYLSVLTKATPKKSPCVWVKAVLWSKDVFSVLLQQENTYLNI